MKIVASNVIANCQPNSALTTEIPLVKIFIRCFLLILIPLTVRYHLIEITILRGNLGTGKKKETRWDRAEPNFN